MLNDYYWGQGEQGLTSGREELCFAVRYDGRAVQAWNNENIAKGTTDPGVDYFDQ